MDHGKEQDPNLGTAGKKSRTTGYPNTDFAKVVGSFGLSLQKFQPPRLSKSQLETLKSIQRAELKASAFIRGLRSTLEIYSHAVAPYVRSMVFHSRVSHIYDMIGLLYHYTYPNDLLAGAGSRNDDWHIGVLEHYRENWDSVSSEIQSNVAGYNVPTATKESFREALDAHGGGLFRSVPRVVFPEIERVLTTNGYRLKSRQFECDVRQLGSELTLEQFPDAILGMPTWEQFVSHVYSPAETPAQVSKLDGNPVPNRHAAIHGVVDYHTEVQSLNALFLVDFMLRLLPHVNYLKP